MWNEKSMLVLVRPTLPSCLPLISAQAVSEDIYFPIKPSDQKLLYFKSNTLPSNFLQIKGFTKGRDKTTIALLNLELTV